MYLLAVLALALQANTFAQTSYTITTSGLTYTPAFVNANVGDTIIWNVDFSMHPLQQVSSASWAADLATPLAGGFSNPAGTTYRVIMTQADTVYYVCRMHVSYGMKGRIAVAASSGINNILSDASHPFPNPADRVLNFTPASTGYFSYTVTDMSGQIVKKGSKYATPQNIISIDVSAVAEGNYIFSLSDANGPVSKSSVSIRH